MGETVKCDGCGSTGLRGLGYVCPIGWDYAEILVEGIPGMKTAPTMYVFACTAECRQMVWKHGPCPRAPGAEAFAAELRRRCAGVGDSDRDAAPAVADHGLRRDAQRLKAARDCEAHEQRSLRALAKASFRSFMNAIRAPNVFDAARASAQAAPCIFSEGTCKAADCPEHGIFPRKP